MYFYLYIKVETYVCKGTSQIKWPMTTQVQHISWKINWDQYVTFHRFNKIKSISTKDVIKMAMRNTILM